MNVKQRLMLVKAGVDIESVLDSFCNNEDAYFNCLHKFLEDGSYNRMVNGISEGNAKEAFEGAHSLKGISGNMGFEKLYSETVKITEVFRAGKLDYEKENFDNLVSEYKNVIETIKSL